MILSLILQLLLLLDWIAWLLQQSPLPLLLNVRLEFSSSVEPASGSPTSTSPQSFFTPCASLPSPDAGACLDSSDEDEDKTTEAHHCSQKIAAFDTQGETEKLPAIPTRTATFTSIPGPPCHSRHLATPASSSPPRKSDRLAGGASPSVGASAGSSSRSSHPRKSHGAMQLKNLLSCSKGRKK